MVKSLDCPVGASGHWRERVELTGRRAVRTPRRTGRPTPSAIKQCATARYFEHPNCPLTDPLLIRHRSPREGGHRITDFPRRKHPLITAGSGTVPNPAEPSRIARLRSYTRRHARSHSPGRHRRRPQLAHRGRHGRVPAETGRRWKPQGAVPVPRGEDAVVPRRPGQGAATPLLLDCGEGRRRGSRSSRKLEHLDFTEAVERLAARGPPRAPLRARAVTSPARSTASAHAAVEGAQRKPRDFYLERPAASSRQPAGHGNVPGRARLLPRRRPESSASATRTNSLGRAPSSTCGRAASPKRGAARGLARRTSRGGLIDRFRDRPDVTPVKMLRGDRRVRRAGKLNADEGTAREVPQHARDRDLQEGPPALRDLTWPSKEIAKRRRDGRRRGATPT